MSNNEYSLLVRTDSYTGNTDCLILAALFGINDGRSGAKTGMELFEKAFGERRDEFEDIAITRSTDEYGMQYYSINNDFHDGYNTLEIYLDEYAIDRVPEIVAMWKDDYKGELNYTSRSYGTEPGKPMTIKLKSFHLKQYIISESIEEIE